MARFATVALGVSDKKKMATRQIASARPPSPKRKREGDMTQPIIADLLRQLAEAQSQRDQLLRALVVVEFVGPDAPPNAYCPWCCKEEGHEHDCIRQDALHGAKEDIDAIAKTITSGQRSIVTLSPDDARLLTTNTRLQEERDELLAACEAAKTVIEYSRGWRRDCFVCGRPVAFPGSWYCSDDCWGKDVAGGKYLDIMTMLRCAIAKARGEQ
jgi:hypothetical protein